MNNTSDELPATPAADGARKPTFLTRKRFNAFDLPTSVLTGLEGAGFTYCTPIQAEVLPLSLTGRDVAGQAQTGTGKTAAFLVTIFKRLLETPASVPGLASALIVAPTRELALQIFEEAELLGRDTGLTFAQVMGGIDYQKQADVLRQGADIVICTPGRIIDYMKQRIFKTDGIRIVVIDEADRLLDLGFAKDMRYILRRLPSYDQRQSMLFSATLSYRVMELTYDYMNLPEFISVTPQEIAVEGVDQGLIYVSNEEKLPLLLGLLERESWSRVLIFVNTRFRVHWLAHKLQGNGLPAEGITGDLPQRKRFKLMEDFKDNRIKILVATDVASRGIHVEDISHVINYDLPQDPEDYIHRIGRTARAGKTGRALTLGCEEYVVYLEAVEKMLGYKVNVLWPEDDWMVADKAGAVPSRKRPRSPAPRSRSGRGATKQQSRRPGPARGRRAAPKSAEGSSNSPIPAVAVAATNPAIDAPAMSAKKKRQRRRSKKKEQPSAQPPTA